MGCLNVAVVHPNGRYTKPTKIRKHKHDKMYFWTLQKPPWTYLFVCYLIVHHNLQISADLERFAGILRGMISEVMISGEMTSGDVIFWEMISGQMISGVMRSEKMISGEM